MTSVGQDCSLPATIHNLKDFNAKRRLKGAVKAVSSVCYHTHLLLYLLLLLMYSTLVPRSLLYERIFYTYA